MITPCRKPAGGELLDWQKEYNGQVNKIRWMIKQAILHFKNWTIMHTDYRRPLKTFENDDPSGSWPAVAVRPALARHSRAAAVVS